VSYDITVAQRVTSSTPLFTLPCRQGDPVAVVIILPTILGVLLLTLCRKYVHRIEPRTTYANIMLGETLVRAHDTLFHSGYLDHGSMSCFRLY
jgi:hypothetical protein